ncbi:MAG: hypothetical protein ACYCY6_02480 [Minisyncoccota bacterium]
MKIIKYLLALVLLVIVGGGLYVWTSTDWEEPKPKSALLVHTYISSPGFVMVDMMQEFEENKKECLGYSRLLNASEVAADAPGLSFCIGLLK